MPDPRLRLLDQVTWEGRVVTSERSQALLASLVAARGSTVGEEALAAAVWGTDDAPAAPGKALQVVVSRTRSQTTPDAVARAERGYRMALPADDVDAASLLGLVQRAQRAEVDGDLTAARDQARSALHYAVADPGADPAAVEEVRAEARARRAVASAVLGRVSSALGEHAEALPLLLDVSEPDEATLAALLRSQAAEHGAAAALTRFERHREDLRDRLGIDPGPLLQQVHRDLLAADNPVRAGVRFESSSLVGRDGDLRALRAAVGQSRVVSILGAGGLGKTRLAHLLGRQAEQAVVHFVELAGVASPDDVVGELGSALGVRDSVNGRRVLTPEQRADVRGRIAQQLDQGPTLLILDNCEHLVDAVAELVAFLVATTRGLRVVTTTRSPLGIAAERVFPLGQLDDGDAATLFRDRARAARPGVRLDEAAVSRVVARLDGLPLAIELAAARVRAMSIEDLARRLDDRFALLRGTDRGAPDRHQTLLAVIDWSWHLLGGAEQTALARLSLFHDGFALGGAEAMVGAAALDVVESLVDQSLLTVVDGRLGVRFRMLETVREFGRLRLGDGDDREAAVAAHVAWARDVCATAAAAINSPTQFEVADLLAEEENNLADVLRDALAAGDVDTVVQVLAALAEYWTIKGEHARVMAVTGAVETVLTDWSPPDALVEATLQAVSMLLLNNSIAELVPARECRRLLGALADRSSSARGRAMASVMGRFEPRDAAVSVERVEALRDSPDRLVAMFAHQLSSHERENGGDPESAITAAHQALALWEHEDGPWMRALLLAQLSGLEAQLGRLDTAAVHAREGLPVLDRLEAHDDASQARAIIAYDAIGAGRLDEAAAVIEALGSVESGGLGGAVAGLGARAELCLARGDVVEGLRRVREAVTRLRSLAFPGLGPATGLEPWAVFGEGFGVTAFARHGTGEDGSDLFAALRAHAPLILQPGARPLDYPVAGVALFALGAWGLLRQGLATEDAVDLLALAQRFAYSRYSPTLSWTVMVEEAERIAPGRLGVRLAGYGERRGPDLLDQARALVARLA